MAWLYERTADNLVRYILGTEGNNPLICFGINPSTAEPNDLDATASCVKRLATANGYDSFIMLNVYPQRAKKPDDLHRTFMPELKAENERHIAALTNGRELTLWAAWGGLIKKRPYLVMLMRSITLLPELQNCKWVTRGNLTKDGHPHHPLYVKKDAPFVPFDILRYNGSA